MIRTSEIIAGTVQISLASRDYIQHNTLLSNVLEISRLGSEVFQTSCFKIWKSCSQHKQTTFCSWAEQREICPCSQKLFVTKYWLDHIRTTFIFISVLLIIIPFKLIPSFTFRVLFIDLPVVVKRAYISMLKTYTNGSTPSYGVKLVIFNICLYPLRYICTFALSYIAKKNNFCVSQTTYHSQASLSIWQLPSENGFMEIFAPVGIQFPRLSIK